MINAVFNHRNFWDMRAQDLFNGVSPFGDRDPDAFLYSAENPENPQPVRVLIEKSSLASQAVGPPTNRFEMSADGRPFPVVGRALTLELRRHHRSLARRLRAVPPLGGPTRAPRRQRARSLQPLAATGPERRLRDLDSPGLPAPVVGLGKLIRVAEDGTTTVVTRPDGNPPTNESPLIEYNFSLFFGLAVQDYESTLVVRRHAVRSLPGEPDTCAAVGRGRQRSMCRIRPGTGRTACRPRRASPRTPGRRARRRARSCTR